MGRIIRPIIVGILVGAGFFLFATFAATALPTAENDPLIIGLGSMVFVLAGFYVAIKNATKK